MYITASNVCLCSAFHRTVMKDVLSFTLILRFCSAKKLPTRHAAKERLFNMKKQYEVYPFSRLRHATVS